MDAQELNEQQAAYRGAEAIPSDWLAEFEAAARRPLETRFRYAFIHTYKPVLDDAPFRAFETTADYTDVERTAVWVGRTIAGMRVWDTLRAIEWALNEIKMSAPAISI